MQEMDADSLAMTWLNGYLKSKGMEPYTIEILEESQQRVRLERMQYLS
jgi:hypothetical protein